MKKLGLNSLGKKRCVLRRITEPYLLNFLSCNFTTNMDKHLSNNTCVKRY